MNVDVKNCTVIPFSVTEQNVRDRFLDWIIEGDETPLDVASTAKITKISKNYYPVRYFSSVSYAAWAATSIWEHKESYTEYKTKTVYIDREGKEHNSPGADYTDRTGKYFRASISSDAYKHPWTPQQKTVPITKYKVVVDNVEETWGELKNEASFHPIITLPADAPIGLHQWILSISIDGETPCIDNLIADCEIQPLLESDEFAQSIATREAQDYCTNQCRKQIPGTRYEDFGLTDFSVNHNMRVVLYPCYVVTYEHNGKTYQLWCSGNASQQLFSCSKPVDNTLHKQAEHLEHVLQDKKKERLKTGAIALIALPILFFGFVYSILSFFMGAVLTIGGIAYGVIFGRKFLAVHKDVQVLQSAKQNRVADLQSKRKAIADIVKNPNMTEEVKRQAIQNILNQQQPS